MPTGDTLLNLIISGGLTLALASLLQKQYEARIGDLKERIAAQSVKIESLLKSNDTLADAFRDLAVAARAAVPAQE